MEDAVPTPPDVHPMMVPRALIAGVIAALSGCSSYSNCDLATCDAGGWIAVDVQNRYARSPGLQMDRLNVQCVDHVAYLYGLVDTQRESDEAVAVARATPGVWRVESTIAIMNSHF